MNDSTSDAVEIFEREFSDDQKYREVLAEERLQSRTEKAVYATRQAMGLTQKGIAGDAARVLALLRQWQQEYGLPARPDGKSHTSVAELFAQWDAEDAAQTPEGVAAERRLWEKGQERRQGVTI